MEIKDFSLSVIEEISNMPVPALMTLVVLSSLGLVTFVLWGFFRSIGRGEGK